MCIFQHIIHMRMYQEKKKMLFGEKMILNKYRSPSRRRSEDPEPSLIPQLDRHQAGIPNILQGNLLGSREWFEEKFVDW